MSKKFEARLSAYLTLEAETAEEAAQQAIAWQEAVADGEGGLAAIEMDSRIASVELAVEDIYEANAWHSSSEPTPAP